MEPIMTIDDAAKVVRMSSGQEKVDLWLHFIDKLELFGNQQINEFTELCSVSPMRFRIV